MRYGSVCTGIVAEVVAQYRVNPDSHHTTGDRHGREPRQTAGASMTAAHQLELEPEPALGFVVRLPEIGNNDLHMPVVRYRKSGEPYARMICTPEYEAWQVEAGHKLNRQDTETIPGRYAIDIILVGTKGCDTDAVLKAANDLLVKHKIVKGDARKHQRHCGVDVWPELPNAGGFPLKRGEMMVRVRALPSAAE